jgi:MinD-like ATPase involved in chromosome partitioning or flagellar assembly
MTTLHRPDSREKANVGLGRPTSEWLTPVRIGASLARLDRDGDYVLIDAPALLSVADPAAVASQADAVILVGARRGTGRKQVRWVLQQLAELNARTAALVANEVSESRFIHLVSGAES